MFSFVLNRIEDQITKTGEKLHHTLLNIFGLYMK